MRKNRDGRDLEGYTDSAVRLQLLYQASDDFSALFNAHARHLDGTARLFRANIIQPGTNQLVDGFDAEKSFIDGANRQELQTYGGSANLTWDLGDIALHSITAYEGIGKYYSRGDIDGGFGAVFAPPSGPGVIPFPVETAGGIKSLTSTARKCAPNRSTTARSTGRPACTTSTTMWKAKTTPTTPSAAVIWPAIS